MKKWHMEGIVGFSDNHCRKLIVPNHRALNLSSSRILKPRRESYVVKILRHGAGLFLRYF